MFFAQKRLGVSYREFATNGYVMAEAQLNIRDTFGVDAITACSDAFRITADLGADMVFPENQTPFAASPLVVSRGDLNKLAHPDPFDPKSRMNDRIRATQEMVRAVGDTCLVLGWVDMPLAEACSVCGVSAFMLMLYDDPLLAHQLLEYLTSIVIDFCLAQLAVGTPMIGAGDAAASLLSPKLYREFALPYEQRDAALCIKRAEWLSCISVATRHISWMIWCTRELICLMSITRSIFLWLDVFTAGRKCVSKAISIR